jgi:hypothetical protein
MDLETEQKVDPFDPGAHICAVAADGSLKRFNHHVIGNGTTLTDAIKSMVEMRCQYLVTDPFAPIAIAVSRSVSDQLNESHHELLRSSNPAENQYGHRIYCYPGYAN